MFMIICVIHDPDQINALLEAWQGIGMPGITILESTGVNRRLNRPHLPMRYALGSAASDRGNYTLMSVVEQEAMIQECLETTEQIIGDLTQPETGIFTAIPVFFSKGIRDKQPFSPEHRRGEDENPTAAGEEVE
jgi:hypothetical protein